jgi:hypothetical protein
MTPEAHKPLKVFCSYSHKDEEYSNVLRIWVRRLERQGLIEWWHDREISTGWEWEEAIDKNLRTADIILLLVTPDFMGSDYVFEKEIDRAVERHERAVGHLPEGPVDPDSFRHSRQDAEAVLREMEEFGFEFGEDPGDPLFLRDVRLHDQDPLQRGIVSSVSVSGRRITQPRVMSQREWEILLADRIY